MNMNIFYLFDCQIERGITSWQKKFRLFFPQKKKGFGDKLYSHSKWDVDTL